MRDFACPNCGQHLAFENSVCLSCGSALGFSLDDMALLVIASGEATFERRVLGPSGFDTIIAMWLPLVWALNMVNRSMGRDDLYPFVLPAAVLEKMRFIHNIIAEAVSDPAKLASAGMTRT